MQSIVKKISLDLYMPFKPVINLRATTIAKAFVLNATVLAIIAACSIELRNYLDIRKETKGLTRFQKMGITMMGTFIIGILVYLIARLLLGFGEGLLANPPFSKKLI
jgi:hypothetical protein